MVKIKIGDMVESKRGIKGRITYISKEFGFVRLEPDRTTLNEVEKLAFDNGATISIDINVIKKVNGRIVSQ